MYPTLSPEKRARLLDGLVIPAHPLLLTEGRALDERRQRALARYYLAAGAGGLAVGVHTTQFALHDDPEMYARVLTIAKEVVARERPEALLIAGVSGSLAQAVREAELARRLGYDLALVIPNGVPNCDPERHLMRLKAVGEVIPLFGFYLQPAVGGCSFGFDYWREVAAIPNVYAIKVAAFNRYFTLDVVRAVGLSERYREIALYTGNDDNIIVDLLTPYPVKRETETVVLHFVGGLLGQWAVWTKTAVRMLDKIKKARSSGQIPLGWLKRNAELTEINGALFDVHHAFRGSIAGIHEALRRDGLADGLWFLDPEEGLSPGQAEAIERIYLTYPEWRDDAFIRDHLKRWLDD
ncbi:MAG: 4-hydroxy-tetrahydrodipicolinate synthase [Candidatus Carbobacillus altaicus]|uniref:4-hydroxy-tetrahydrodipicolinate synthase n=1 Tax=Candidatus Carbonibacillus altaicus TaxID=2163959 RepID=A0A2R6Y3Y6_9BACL|nr:MAG: 4-hydroxy-tetrahydrodipicolinate synthase [Candidatus Carbobacillus altaicus]